MKRIRYNVLSPDGFTIRRNKTYTSRRKALEDTLEWIKRYEIQGYYSTNYRIINLEELLDHCVLVDDSDFTSSYDFPKEPKQIK